MAIGKYRTPCWRPFHSIDLILKALALYRTNYKSKTPKKGKRKHMQGKEENGMNGKRCKIRKGNGRIRRGEDGKGKKGMEGKEREGKEMEGKGRKEGKGRIRARLSYDLATFYVLTTFLASFDRRSIYLTTFLVS